MMASNPQRRLLILNRACSLWLALFAVLSGCRDSQPDAATIELCNRGVGLMGQFDYGAAHDVFAKLVERAPDWQQGKINLAIATLNRQLDDDVERAQAIFREVLTAEPNNLRANYCLGLLQLFGSSPADALARFQLVADKDREDAYAAYYAGQCLYDTGDAEAALPYFQRSRKLNPYLRSSYYGEFLTLQRLQRPDDAREALEAFNRLENNPQAVIAEFKYNRMGPKAMAMALDQTAPALTPLPNGPLFAAAAPLVKELPAGFRWADFSDGGAPRPSITACDIDADGQVDLLLASAATSQGKAQCAILWQRGGEFVVDVEHPLAQVDNVNAVLWGDYDNDGLVDCYFCRRGPNRLFRQAAAGKWEDVTEATGTGGGEFDTIDGAMVDLDHDGDLDLWLVRANGPSELFSNNLDGTFRPIAAEAGLAGNGKPAVGTLVADLDGDRDADLVVLHAEPPHDVFLNDRLWRYQAGGREWEAITTDSFAALVAGDGDANGAIDLFAAGEGRLARWSRGSDGLWKKTAIAADIGNNKPQLGLADLDGSGRVKAIASTAAGWRIVAADPPGAASFEAKTGGPCVFALAALDTAKGYSVVAMASGQAPQIWRPGAGRHAFADVAFTGQRDKGKQTRSNASGIGVRVAARGGSRWTIIDTLRTLSGPGQSLQPLPLGLGGAKSLDFVAVDWPDGVFQTELSVGAAKPSGHTLIGENQRQTSSCPVLFVWDGQQYQFVTDLLGVGGLGFLVEAGTYAPVRPWENLALPAELAPPAGSTLRMLLAEPMEEVCYLDTVALSAIDVPPGWRMILDERMNILGAEPTGQPLFYRELVEPVAATNDRDQDVLADISAVDRRAAPVGPADPRFIGLCQEHEIVLEFARALDVPTGRPVLVASGWIEYPYSQTMFAAEQAGAKYRAPTLEARDAGGVWRLVAEQFGYPAGMPREMALPLENLPPGCTALRITTNEEIYWDYLAVAFAQECPQAVQTEIPLASATVNFSGFPRRTDGEQRQPRYDFHRRSPTWDVRTPRGMYTQFGPALPLLAAADSACAIFGPGEAVELEFAAPPGEPSPGWTRRWVLKFAGWCKDMDLYTQHGETVDPLPARAAATSAEIQRRDILHRQWNTRYRSGR